MAQKIKEIYHINDNFPIEDDKYDKWLKSLLNKTENEITENDVYTMFCQHELEDLAIQKAIEFILEDPLAGELEDGQFLEQLANAPLSKLTIYRNDLKKLPSYIENHLDDSMWDFDFEKEEFMERYIKFKKMVETL